MLISRRIINYSYDEFARLHKALQLVDSKVARLPFPNNAKKGVNALANELNNYIHLLMGDISLRYHPKLQAFLGPSAGRPKESASNSNSNLQLNNNSEAKTFTDSEIMLFLENGFQLFEECFDTEASFVLRRLLGVIKGYIKSNYIPHISSYLDRLSITVQEPSTLASWIDHITETCWPDGVWGEAAPSTSAAEDEELRQHAKIVWQKFVASLPGLDSMLGR